MQTRSDAESDTAEDFLDVERRAVLGVRERFAGYLLAPYSEGVRLLWMDTWQSTTVRFASLGLIWLMRRLQEEYEKLGKMRDEDNRWLHASAVVIEENETRSLTKAKVAKWAGELGEKQTLAAMTLANRILEEASETDAKDDAAAEEANAEGGEPGNVPAPLPVSAST